MEYHFVVKYDSTTDTFEMDYDTQEGRFGSCPIYDPEKNEWIALEESHWGNDQSDYNKSGDAIWSAIRNLKLNVKPCNCHLLDNDDIDNGATCYHCYQVHKDGLCDCEGN